MKNRRFGSGVMIKLFIGILIVSWAVLLVVILTTARNPVYGTFLQRLKTAGHVTMIKIYGILIFTAFISFSGIIINLFRMKRRSDKLRFTFIFSCILSVAGLVLMNMK